MSSRYDKVKPPTNKEFIDTKERLDSLSEGVCKDEYTSMFNTLRKLIRKQETLCLSSEGKGRDLYALNMLYSQMRELLIDIRTISDNTEQANMLIQQSIIPMCNDIQQLLTDSYYQMKKLVQEICQKDKLTYAEKNLNNIFLSQGRLVQDSSVRSKSTCLAILTGKKNEIRRKKSS